MSTEGKTPAVVVKWETLGGTVKRQRFTTWAEAQEFADRKEAANGTQWVDVEEASK